MNIKQFEVRLRPRPRGFHLITREILDVVGDDLSGMSHGLCHIFIQHTSAALAINENADPDVRHDFETHFNRMVPEDTSLYRHTLEGPDDMTSHIKSSILGHELTILVSRGRLNMGIWQGVYLCEHRNAAGSRNLVVTLTGE